MALLKFSLDSIQTLSDLQECPLFLDIKGIFSDEISSISGISPDRFTGSLVLGVLGDLREVWITRNVNPALMQAKYKRIY